MTINELEQKAFVNANGKPFGGAAYHELTVRFVMTDSPSLGRKSYPRFTYYFGKNRITRKGVVEILNNYSEFENH